MSEAVADRSVGVVAAVVAAAAALGVAELVAVVTGPQSAPLVAVGGAVVDRSPAPLTEFGIAVFGTYDKAALLIGTGVLLAGLAAGLGAATRRWRWLGWVGLSLFTVIGVTAALTRHEATLPAALPTLAGAGVGGAAFLFLHRRAPHHPPPGNAEEPRSATGASAGRPDRIGTGPGRRGFLRAAGWVLGGAVVVGVGGRWLTTRRDVAAARASVRLPAPIEAAPPVPAGAELGLPELASYVTGNDRFYRIDTALVVPRVDPDSWRLRIHGLVGRPYEVTFAELLARPMIERYLTLSCVSNEVGGELVGNARWLGVPVAELLTAADPLPGADQVVSRSVDGWTCGTPTEVLRDGRDALLAVGMNGEPLPAQHGFPVRMVVPGLYGYVSACKWITELELSRFADYDAYWVPRGWAAQAPIKTQSRIDTPRRRVSPGLVPVAGVAWAQHRGIDRVEVRVDGGQWQLATLADTVSADTWRQWSWRWQASPGIHQLTVRATDSLGETQPAEPTPVAPDGATGWHRIEVEVA